MNFRDACMIQHQLIIRSSSDIQSLAARFKDERYFACSIWQRDTSHDFDVRHRRRCGWNHHTSLSYPLCFVFLSQVFFKVAKVRIDRNSSSEDVDFRIDANRRERSVAMIVDVIDCGRQDLILQVVEDFGWCFGVCAPFHLQYEVMWSDATLASFIADAFVNEFLHTLNEFGSGEAAPGIYGATELAID